MSDESLGTVLRNLDDKIQAGKGLNELKLYLEDHAKAI